MCEDVRDPVVSDGSESLTPAGENAPPTDLPVEVSAVPPEPVDYRDRWLRSEADLQNFRRRANRECEDAELRAEERVLLEIIALLDDLERALEAAAAHEEAKLEEGVQLVQRALAAALKREGLVEIATEGPFDPHVHEALLSQPSEGAESGTVLQVLQKGYRLGDRVLRPARVIVAE